MVSMILILFSFLILIPLTSCDHEPTFDKNNDDPLFLTKDIAFNPVFFGFKDQKGLETMWSGKAFYSGLPIRVFKYINEKNPTINFDGKIDPLTRNGQLEVFGQLPSPTTRELPQEFSNLSLSQSVFFRDKTQYINGNCFSCHAGVAIGSGHKSSIVAGTANNYTNQYSLLSKSLDLKKLFIDKEFYGNMKDDLELSSEEQISINAFVKFVQTLLEPPFKYADTVGDNVGPYPVWIYLSNLIDPAIFGFEAFENQRSKLDLLKFKKVYPGLSDKKVSDLYHKAYDEFENVKDFLKNIKYPTIKPNPWYHRKYRKSWGYWYGSRFAGMNSHAHVHYTNSFTVDHPGANERHEEHTKTIKKILEFVNATQSPPYPGKLDGKLVQKGHKLYTNYCSHCHGSTSKQENKAYETPGYWTVNYTNTSLKQVGTDPEYNKTIAQFKKLNDEFKKIGKERDAGFKEFWSIRGKPELAPPLDFVDQEGYMPPPLVGVWAAAPYFHNGSVPTLEQVLDPDKRPSVWKRISLYNSREFSNWDSSIVGLPHKILTEDENVKFKLDKEKLNGERNEEKTFSKKFIDVRMVYNTLEFGRSNRGHEFGRILNFHERKAVIEFLKSFSGPGMKPQ